MELDSDGYVVFGVCNGGSFLVLGPSRRLVSELEVLTALSCSGGKENPPMFLYLK